MRWQKMNDTDSTKDRNGAALAPQRNAAVSAAFSITGRMPALHLSTIITFLFVVIGQFCVLVIL
jgi:hypothetical protein